MISEQNIATLTDATVVDSDGDKIGRVGQIFVDTQTGRPNWATVKTGFFGTSESFVPLDQADEVNGDLRVPYSKDVVKDAPRIDTDSDLTQSEEDNLYAYYERLGMPRTSGWVLKSCSRSCAEVVASASSRSITNPMLTRSSPVLASFIG